MERINVAKVAPAAYKALTEVGNYVKASGMDELLGELVKIRVSQINGCAFCLDMHWKDARALGETEERLYMLGAWHEADIYTDKERAALAWAESVTLLNETRIPDEVYEATRQHFDEQEIINLTLAIVSINSWNRMSVAFRKPAGRYVSPRKPIAEVEAS